MKILDIPISEKNYKDILSEFSELSKGYVCVTSVHGLIEAYENTNVKEAFHNSTYNVPDGMPIVLFAKFIKKIKPFSRVYGPEFLINFLKHINLRKSRLYIVGSNEKNISRFEKVLKNTHNNISIVGKNCDIIDINNDDQVKKIYDGIPKDKVDYVLVFLSTPKQDVLMHKFYLQENNLKCIGFGAAIDFYIGDLKSPPLIVQNLSLEWLYRLIQEPKRLFRRYLKIVPKFLYLVLIDTFFIKSKES